MGNLSVQVPLLDLRLQYQAIKAEVRAAVDRVVESQNFILGPEVSQFETEAATYCGSRFSLGVSSGTDALILALMGLGIGPGDEVITSPYTFFATAGSISRVGAKPVFVDIERDSFNIDANLIEEKIGSNTRAIMPVHLYGQCVDMDAVTAIARAHELPVVEDAAQAIGAKFRGIPAGACTAAGISGIGCFSFFPSKNLGAFGDAGLISVSDEKLYEHLKILRVHGGERRYFHDFVGGNFRIDALQAAVLAVKLKYLESWTEGRRRNAEIYQRLFTESGLAAPSLKEGRVVLPTELANRRHIYNQYVVRVRERDALIEELARSGVGNAIYYPVPLHLQKCFASLGYSAGDFPESELAASETIALPIFPELVEEQLEYVVQVISEFYKRR